MVCNAFVRKLGEKTWSFIRLFIVAEAASRTSVASAFLEIEARAVTTTTTFSAIVVAAAAATTTASTFVGEPTVFTTRAVAALERVAHAPWAVVVATTTPTIIVAAAAAAASTFVSISAISTSGAISTLKRVAYWLATSPVALGPFLYLALFASGRLVSEAFHVEEFLLAFREKEFVTAVAAVQHFSFFLLLGGSTTSFDSRGWVFTFCGLFGLFSFLRRVFDDRIFHLCPFVGVIFILRVVRGSGTCTISTFTGRHIGLSV
jgi:predicted neutral ceramidase superfamily lipid hydrolase